MSRHERLNAILALLAGDGRLSVEDAVRQLGVSAATVRRDFDHLAQQQLLTRTHGGAVSTATTYELPLRYKIARHAEAKLRIAEMAAAMAPLGGTVALNGGTTTNEVARAIVRRSDLATDPRNRRITVVTNALNIATELAVRPQVKIVVVGGVARPQSYELIGPLTDEILDQVTADIAFIGVDAVDPDVGAMAYHEGEARVNRNMAARADKVVLVADSSKLHRRAFALICPLSDVDMLLTEEDPGEGARRQFADQGVEVIVVD